MSSVTATITSPQRHQQKKREINLTDDPDKLLNEWLGELENLIGVSILWKLLIAHYENPIEKLPELKAEPILFINVVEPNFIRKYHKRFFYIRCTIFFFFVWKIKPRGVSFVPISVDFPRIQKMRTTQYTLMSTT